MTDQSDMAIRKLLVLFAIVAGAIGLAAAPTHALSPDYSSEDWGAHGFWLTTDISANDWVAGSGPVGNATLPMVRRVGDPASKKISNWSGTAVEVNDINQAVIHRANNQLILWDFGKGTSTTINRPVPLQDFSVQMEVVDFNNAGSILLDGWNGEGWNAHRYWIGTRTGVFWMYTELEDFVPKDLNNAGVVAGTAKGGHAATWTSKSGVTELSPDPVGGTSGAASINDSGIVVGTMNTIGKVDGFVWNPLTKKKVSLDAQFGLPKSASFLPAPEGLSAGHSVIGDFDFAAALDGERVLVVLDLIADEMILVDWDTQFWVESPIGLSANGHSAHRDGNGIYRRIG